MMDYYKDNWIIFYFSGTGNAAFAAKYISKALSKESIKVQVIDIAKTTEESIPQIEQGVNLMFCYPTHGFNAPPVIIKFLRQFPSGKQNMVYLLNTRAGMKLYKWFTPGLSGCALFLPAFMLRLKNYIIRGYRPLDMPSNWISLHPGIRERVVKSILKRCKEILDSFSLQIKNKQTVYRGWLDLPLDIMVFPISVGYYFIGRLALAKTFFADAHCNNCGICVKNCPVKGVKMVFGRPFWTHRCESCMKCLNHCPKYAIQTAHGFTFLLWWFIFSVLPLIGISKINQMFDFEWSGACELMLISIIGLFIVFVVYYGLSYLLRYPWFNALIAYSSLTKLPFWKRYKCPKNNI